MDRRRQIPIVGCSLTPASLRLRPRWARCSGGGLSHGDRDHRAAPHREGGHHSRRDSAEILQKWISGSLDLFGTDHSGSAQWAITFWGIKGARRRDRPGTARQGASQRARAPQFHDEISATVVRVNEVNSSETKFYVSDMRFNRKIGDYGGEPYRWTVANFPRKSGQPTLRRCFRLRRPKPYLNKYFKEPNWIAPKGNLHDHHTRRCQQNRPRSDASYPRARRQARQSTTGKTATSRSSRWTIAPPDNYTHRDDAPARRSESRCRFDLTSRSSCLPARAKSSFQRRQYRECSTKLHRVQSTCSAARKRDAVAARAESAAKLVMRALNGQCVPAAGWRSHMAADAAHRSGKTPEKIGPSRKVALGVLRDRRNAALSASGRKSRLSR